MSPRETPPYHRRDLLMLGLWWGLVSGLAEGFIWFTKHSVVWHDQMRASVIVDSLLFPGIALLILLLNPALVVTRSIAVRATLGFSFLLAFCCSGRLLPHLSSPLGFLISLLAAALLAWSFFLAAERALHFQWRSLPVLLLAGLICLVLFPLEARRAEARQMAELGKAPARARNVLVIVVDTLRADHLSAYGYGRPTSPNLEKLAREGVLFENAISPSSWTLPAHASMLTGLYPHDHQAVGDASDLGTNYPTLAEAMKGLSYRTAAFSANTALFSRQRGFGRGFLHFEDNFQRWGSYFVETFYGGKIASRLCQFHLLRDLPGRLTAEDINRHALRWIDSDSRPFFVFLNYYDAHDPYLPPEPYVHYYTKAKDPGRWYTSHWESFENLSPVELQAAMDAYDGAINYVDTEIGSLLEALAERGLSDNTLVIITSDHGEGFSEHGLMNHGNSLYRELIDVPLIMRAPGSIPAGRRIADPVSLTALPSTILDVLGHRDPQAFPSPALSQLWTGGEHNSLGPVMSELAQLFWDRRFPDYYGPMQSVVTPEWHYIVGGNTGEQLFRCCDAGDETTNLADTAEGKRACEQLRQELQLAMKSRLSGSSHPIGIASNDPEHREQRASHF